MADYSEQFLQETIQVWQPHNSEPLSLENAQEIVDNILNLYSYLNELNEKYAEKENI